MTHATASSLLLFGAGGHARVVADAVLCQGAWSVLAASDRDPQKCSGELLPGIELVDLPRALVLEAALHVAIGNNAARELESAALGMQRLVTVTHRDASVAPTAVLRPGCFVAARAVVAPLARLGTGVIVNHGAVVDHDAVVGDFTHVAPGAMLGGAVRLGKRVLVGAGAVVLPGIAVADDVVIAAGCVVNKPLHEAGTYAGMPARRLK
ncbi:MAG: NeuD/PglB/VioB family sugar acetyltransferase [Ramlibacter sp.]